MGQSEYGRHQRLAAAYTLLRMTGARTNTEVHFQSSAFNTSEPKHYFMNPCCFGDDVCRWMIQELRTRGAEADDEPGQEDFGWYLTFWADKTKHFFVIGFQPGEGATPGQWIGWLERAGLLSRVFGRRRGVSPRAFDLANEVLSSSAKVSSVSWLDQ